MHWFRKALRLHDNPALYEACKEPVHLIFILDPTFETQTISTLRWSFLWDSLEDLNINLMKHSGRGLTIEYGKPVDVITHYIKNYHVKRITAEYDCEPYACARDDHVRKLCQEHGVEFELFVSHTLVDPRVGARNVVSFKSFVGKLQVDRQPLPVPPKIGNLNTKPFVRKYERLNTSGGESNAITKWKTIRTSSKIFGFNKPFTLDTTRLSAYIKFGCISVTVIYNDLLQIPTDESIPLQSKLLGQLYWREYFYHYAAITPNFGKIINNPICKQISWNTNREWLSRWEYSLTGYPLIDAIMTELRTTGYLHHMKRQVTACFLTRGDLHLSWIEGAKIFEKYLIDWDWSINNANWMWCSGSAFNNQPHNIFDPNKLSLMKGDADYVRKWLPYITNPSNPCRGLPIVQKSFDMKEYDLKYTLDGAVVNGTWYPLPILIHSRSRDPLALYDAETFRT